MKKFSIGKELSYGWETAKAHLPFFVVIILIELAISFIPNIITKDIRQEVPMLSVLLGFAFWVLSMLISLGGAKIALKIVDTKKAEVVDLFNSYPRLLNFIAAYILYLLMVLIGFFLLVVPGFIFSIKYGFFPYFILDKKMGPLEALKKSGDITKGSKWQLFLFYLACGLVNLVGILALGIGLFITIPLTALAHAHVYRKLLGASGK